MEVRVNPLCVTRGEEQTLFASQAAVLDMASHCLEAHVAVLAWRQQRTAWLCGGWAGPCGRRDQAASVPGSVKASR
jgi:hypothetical protein